MNVPNYTLCPRCGQRRVTPCRTGPDQCGAFNLLYVPVDCVVITREEYEALKVMHREPAKAEA